MKKLVTKIEKNQKEVELDQHKMRIGDRMIRIVDTQRGGCLVEIGEERFVVDEIIELDEKDTFRIEIGGYTVDVKVEDPVSQALTGTMNSSGEIESPMSGQISNIHVAVDQEVKEGQLLLVISAMKMENKINAPLTGKITKINCEIGETVQSGGLLIVIEPTDD